VKVSVIGAGAVGSQLAFALAIKNYENIAIIDIKENLARARALDIMQSSSLWGFEGKVKGSGEYKDIEGSDIVVTTAGLARKPGMTREALFDTNCKITRSVAAEIGKHAPGCIMIVVTNPLDIMAYIAYRESGFSPEKVMGMAGVLDTARYKYFISEKLSCSPSEVEALVLGMHGADMVITDGARAGKKNLKDFLSVKDLQGLKERTKKAGKEVVELLGSGSASFAPAASVSLMVDSIRHDRKEILPCSVHTRSAYGLGDIFIGLPAVIGRAGVEEVVEEEIGEAARKELLDAGKKIEKKIRKLEL